MFEAVRDFFPENPRGDGSHSDNNRYHQGRNRHRDGKSLIIGISFCRSLQFITIVVEPSARPWFLSENVANSTKLSSDGVKFMGGTPRGKGATQLN